MTTTTTTPATLTHLKVERAHRVRRSVPAQGGVKDAIDTVVRATAPSLAHCLLPSSGSSS